jgi:hypothetical protein
MLGLLRFMVGYERVRNDLCRREYGQSRCPSHSAVLLRYSSIACAFQFLQLSTRCIGSRDRCSEVNGSNIPDSRALLRSLAKEESHLAERFCESVLCRHGEVVGIVRVV